MILSSWSHFLLHSPVLMYWQWFLNFFRCLTKPHYFCLKESTSSQVKKWLPSLAGNRSFFGVIHQSSRCLLSSPFPFPSLSEHADSSKALRNLPEFLADSTVAPRPAEGRSLKHQRGNSCSEHLLVSLWDAWRWNHKPVRSAETPPPPAPPQEDGGADWRAC